MLHKICNYVECTMTMVSDNTSAITRSPSVASTALKKQQKIEVLQESCAPEVGGCKLVNIQRNSKGCTKEHKSGCTAFG